MRAGYCDDFFHDKPMARGLAITRSASVSA